MRDSTWDGAGQLVAVRSRLSQKLSQANAYNRFLLREVIPTPRLTGSSTDFALTSNSHVWKGVQALESEKSIKAYKGELGMMTSQIEVRSPPPSLLSTCPEMSRESL